MTPPASARTLPLASPATAGVTPLPADSSQAGYWTVATDGSVAGFDGAPVLGSASGTSLAPVVGMSSTPTGRGYWQVALDGGVFSFGDARFFGSAAGVPVAPVLGLAPVPSGLGYWLVASDGGVFSFGDARFFGSTGGLRLNRPVVGTAATPSGSGYWLVAGDGGIFTFGDAGFFGSTGGVRLNEPVVGMAPTPSGQGYWLVASDGGVFSFGDAAFFGSAAGVSAYPVVGLLPTSTGQGYWLAAADGGVFSFGDAHFGGSATGRTAAPSIGITRPGGPPAMGGGFVVAGSPSTPVVALTFDDGPDPSHTAGILEILSRFRVPATFFVLGQWAGRWPDLVREEARRGHSVQNHTWSHANVTRLSDSAFASQIDPTSDLIGRLAGVRPRCLRPPGGNHNAASDQRAAQHGLHVATWNVDPRDWTWISADQIVNRILSQLKPVSVVVLHDRTHIIDALPTLIEQLRARGYHFATICQTSGTSPGAPL
jgi:peptidoglycan/xylan/chitin deacetylase (PgdA/CDA1 family)